MKVILDTNVFTLFGQGIDVFIEIDKVIKDKYEFVIPDLVLQELEKLSKKTTKDGRAARLGNMIVQERLARQKEPLVAKLLFPSKEIPLKTVQCSEKHADDAIVRIAEDDGIVATLDKGLQRRLLKNKIRVLSIQQKHFIIKE
ncbi:hypothetical protein GOV07_02145 [Candidatus Woesearchaeota archaeon]|nr:hypothetical protein [Candidatus Woesearchaeota archaeon]